MNLLEKVGNVSDGAMLLLACITIAVPRVMISMSQNEQKKKIMQKKKEESIQNATSREPETNTAENKERVYAGNDGQISGDSKERTTYDRRINSTIFATIPQ
jgi:hypothetical protein